MAFYDRRKRDTPSRDETRPTGSPRQHHLAAHAMAIARGKPVEKAGWAAEFRATRQAAKKKA